MSLKGQNGKTRRPPPPGGGKEAVIAQKQFEANLKAALQTHGQMSEGRIYLFSLERVREALKDNWERLSLKVHSTAASVIEHRLSSQEFFIQYGDVHYVIAFGDLDEARARIKLALMAQEIGQRLLGSALSESLIDVKTAEVSADGEISLSRSASVDALVREQRTKEESVDPTAPTRDGHKVGPGTMASGVHFIFRPLWFVKKRVISNYFCIPVVTKAEGGFDSGYDVLRDPRAPEQIRELDILTLNRVARELSLLEKQKLPSLLCLPVHFETLATQRHRIEYANICASVLGRGKPRVVFELVGLPDGIPQSRIQGLAQTVKPFARTVMARFDLSHRTFAAYNAAGLSTVGADIYGDHRAEKVLMKEMDDFVEAASKNGLHTYIHGVHSLSLNTAAICSGFDYVDGYAITSVEEGAKDIRFFDINTPYDQKFAGGNGGEG